MKTFEQCCDEVAKKMEGWVYETQLIREKHLYKLAADLYAFELCRKKDKRTLDLATIQLVRRIAQQVYLDSDEEIASWINNHIRSKVEEAVKLARVETLDDPEYAIEFRHTLSEILEKLKL